MDAVPLDHLTRIVNVSWGRIFAFGGAVGTGNGVSYIQVSGDGSTWRRLASVETINDTAVSIARGAGCWLIYENASAKIYRSTDAVTWSPVLMPAAV